MNVTSDFKDMIRKKSLMRIHWETLRARGGAWVVWESNIVRDGEVLGRLLKGSDFINRSSRRRDRLGESNTFWMAFFIRPVTLSFSVLVTSWKAGGEPNPFVAKLIGFPARTCSLTASYNLGRDLPFAPLGLDLLTIERLQGRGPKFNGTS